MPEYPVLVKKEGAVASLVLNRPKVMNAVNVETMKSLWTSFERLSSENSVRVIIIEGAGDNFCAGADMALLSENYDSSRWYCFMKNYVSRLILAMRTASQPIICKVRGNAYGFGVGLALAGDFVIAAEDARFCESFVNIGVTLDGGSSYFLPRLVGMARAREIALLGGVINGKDAASIGLIYRAVPTNSLNEETIALSQSLLRKSGKALANIKEAIEGSFQRSPEEALEWEASHQAIFLNSEELKAAVRQFLKEKGDGK
jgi:2-(1,2-epoxy-1,2-dihydrophenyl)acetyl-CoA isomerase